MQRSSQIVYGSVCMPQQKYQTSTVTQKSTSLKRKMIKLKMMSLKNYNRYKL